MPQWYENCFTALHPWPWTGDLCSQIVHDRPGDYGWHYVSLALEDDVGNPMNLMSWWATNPKSSSCCSRSCCLCHQARDTSTNKINICPVMRISPTLSSSNTWNPLGVGTEKKLHVVFTFRNCPARNNSLLSFPLHQQDSHWIHTEKNH